MHICACAATHTTCGSFEDLFIMYLSKIILILAWFGETRCNMVPKARIAYLTARCGFIYEL